MYYTFRCHHLVLQSNMMMMFHERSKLWSPFVFLLCLNVITEGHRIHYGGNHLFKHDAHQKPCNVMPGKICDTGMTCCNSKCTVVPTEVSPGYVIDIPTCVGNVSKGEIIHSSWLLLISFYVFGALIMK